MHIQNNFNGTAKKGQGSTVLTEHRTKITLPVHTRSFPVELLNISDQIRLRTAISELGPIIFPRNLNLNDTRSTSISTLSKYCADRKMPFLDLLNIKKVKHYIIKKGKDEIEDR